ncbi:hypothetical protein Tco_1001157, partial [Tanacetum coccineum]
NVGNGGRIGGDDGERWLSIEEDEECKRKDKSRISWSHYSSLKLVRVDTESGVDDGGMVDLVDEEGPTDGANLLVQKACRGEYESGSLDGPGRQASFDIVLVLIQVKKRRSAQTRVNR